MKITHNGERTRMFIDGKEDSYHHRSGAWFNDIGPAKKFKIGFCDGFANSNFPRVIDEFLVSSEAEEYTSATEKEIKGAERKKEKVSLQMTGNLKSPEGFSFYHNGKLIKNTKGADRKHINFILEEGENIIGIVCSPQARINLSVGGITFTDQDNWRISYSPENRWQEREFQDHEWKIGKPAFEKKQGYI